MFSPNSLDIRPAWQVSLLVWLPFCAALVLTVTSSLPIWMVLPVSLVILLGGHRAASLHGRLNHPDSLVRLFTQATRPRECELWDRAQRRQWARILPESVVTARLVLLSVVLPAGRRRVLILTPWNCEAEAFRRLRVILRMQAPPSKTPAPAPDKGVPAE